jgi:hypothetical protein
MLLDEVLKPVTTLTFLEKLEHELRLEIELAVGPWTEFAVNELGKHIGLV